MRINYGSQGIDFSWIMMALSIVVILLPTELGQTMIYGPVDLEHPRENFQKYVAFAALGITLIQFRKLSPFMRNWLLITLAYCAVLSLESLFVYGTVFQYPHVVSKFFVIFSSTAIYVTFRGMPERAFTATVLVFISVFLYNQFVHYRDVLSLGSFMNTERGMHASMVDFLMAGWAFTLASYLPRRSLPWLLLFFLLTGLILFLNHRTVWLASITTVLIFFYLVNFRGTERYSYTAFTPIIVVPLIGIIALFSYVFAEKPELLNTVLDRVSDIQNVNKQGTGKWRIQQFTSYLPFILDHPLFGMRYAGFELPVQFFADQTGKEVFIAHTGHHFHSYYIDSLFYHGLAGLALLSAIYFQIAKKLFTTPVAMPLRVIALGAWALSCLQYGLSYVIDDWQFGVAGFALVFMDTYLMRVDQQRALEQTHASEEEEAAYSDESAQEAHALLDSNS